MTKRCSRFERSGSASPLVVTDRDVAIITTCWEYRWLTRDQLQRLIDLPGITRTNARLRRLYDQGFLERRRAGTVGAGLQPVYLAGDQAVELIAQRYSLALGEVRQ